MTVSKSRGPDLAELARMLPVPADRDLPAGRQQIIREHLVSEFRGAAAGQAPGSARSASDDPQAWRPSARRPFPKRRPASRPSARLRLAWRPRRRRIVIVAATSCILVLAAAAGLMLVTAKPPRPVSGRGSTGLGPAGGAGPNWNRPLPGAKRTTVAGAQASVGFGVPLPHGAVASRGDLTGVWVIPRLVVELVFDGGRVTIIMQRATYRDPARWFRTELAEIKTGSAVLGTVSGQPAVVVTARTDADRSNPALVQFDRHGIDIHVISTSYGPATLVRIADSVR